MARPSRVQLEADLVTLGGTVDPRWGWTQLFEAVKAAREVRSSLTSGVPATQGVSAGNPAEQGAPEGNPAEQGAPEGNPAEQGAPAGFRRYPSNPRLPGNLRTAGRSS